MSFYSNMSNKNQFHKFTQCIMWRKDGVWLAYWLVFDCN